MAGKISSRNRGAHILKASGMAEKQARMDVTAALTAKLLYETTGNGDALALTMAEMCADPERMGTCMITLINLLAQFATSSGTRPNGLQELVDYLISTIGPERN